MKILCCCYPLLNSLSLCFYFTIASSRFLYTCNLTNRKRPEDFLVQKESSLVCSASVTMPWVRRASFLLSQTVQKYNSVFWCQCPERGDLHFYGMDYNRRNIRWLVSMPWKGRPPFLPSRRSRTVMSVSVSMPWKGRPSFLLCHSIS